MDEKIHWIKGTLKTAFGGDLHLLIPKNLGGSLLV